jgi:ABC-type uncharacterized transport system permease subunit
LTRNIVGIWLNCPISFFQFLRYSTATDCKMVYSESYCNMHIPNLIRGRKVNLVGKPVEMKLHLINCLFAKNVMIPNKIVYKPRWEYVSFLSRALVHHGYALVNYLSSRQEWNTSHLGMYYSQPVSNVQLF